jgi:hypothetical protein
MRGRGPQRALRPSSVLNSPSITLSAGLIVVQRGSTKTMSVVCEGGLRGRAARRSQQDNIPQ